MVEQGGAASARVQQSQQRQPYNAGPQPAKRRCHHPDRWPGPWPCISLHMHPASYKARNW
eukprot:scaffold5182_cov376-Prasinococcus_capsulatus_cf.AAC.2